MPAAHHFRADAIARAKAGVRPGELAADYGVAPEVIYQILKDARRSGEVIPRFRPIRRARPDEAWLRVRLDPTARRILEREAAARGLSVSDLAGALLSAVAADRVAIAVMGVGGGR